MKMRKTQREDEDWEELEGGLSLFAFFLPLLYFFFSSCTWSSSEESVMTIDLFDSFASLVDRAVTNEESFIIIFISVVQSNYS